MKYARSIIAGLGLLGLICASGAALAQSAAPKADAAHTATPVPAEPQSTVSSYGDWVLRCQRVEASGKNSRVCEVAEAFQVQGQANPIAQLAIGRLSPGEPLRVTVVVPPTVAFPSNVRVADAKNGPALTLDWRRCLPVGCFADGQIRDDLLARWRGQTEAGQVIFKDAAGRDVSLPLSFRGLAQALDALAKETR